MRPTNPAFLTIFIEADALPEDPRDSSAQTKHAMMAAADRLVDGAVNKMPGYLKVLPQEVRPSVADIASALRRSYRLNGNRLEVDVSMRRDSLPGAWVESLSAPEFLPDPNHIPWPIRWTALIMGWWMGVNAKDRQKVMKEAHEATIKQRRAKIEDEICRGLMQLASAAVEIELRAGASDLVGKNDIRRISIARAF